MLVVGCWTFKIIALLTSLSSFPLQNFDSLQVMSNASTTAPVIIVTKFWSQDFFDLASFPTAIQDVENHFQADLTTVQESN